MKYFRAPRCFEIAFWCVSGSLFRKDMFPLRFNMSIQFSRVYLLIIIFFHPYCQIKLILVAKDLGIVPFKDHITTFDVLAEHRYILELDRDDVVVELRPIGALTSCKKS